MRLICFSIRPFFAPWRSADLFAANGTACDDGDGALRGSLASARILNCVSQACTSADVCAGGCDARLRRRRRCLRCCLRCRRCRCVVVGCLCRFQSSRLCSAFVAAPILAKSVRIVARPRAAHACLCFVSVASIRIATTTMCARSIGAKRARARLRQQQVLACCIAGIAPSN